MLEFGRSTTRRNIEDETRELVAEGRRRLREREGLPPVGVDSRGRRGFLLQDGTVVSGFVGKAKLAGAGMPIADAVKVAEAMSEVFEMYTPTEDDDLGLVRELEDLERDATSLERHEQVRYE